MRFGVWRDKIIGRGRAEHDTEKAFWGRWSQASTRGAICGFFFCFFKFFFIIKSISSSPNHANLAPTYQPQSIARPNAVTLRKTSPNRVSKHDIDISSPTTGYKETGKKKKKSKQNIPPLSCSQPRPILVYIYIYRYVYTCYIEPRFHLQY